MARVADLFTGGGYSKALKERDRTADQATSFENVSQQANQINQQINKGAVEVDDSRYIGQRLNAAKQPQQMADVYSVADKSNKAALEAANKNVYHQYTKGINNFERLKKAVVSPLIAAAQGGGMYYARRDPDDPSPISKAWNATKDWVRRGQRDWPQPQLKPYLDRFIRNIIEANRVEKAPPETGTYDERQRDDESMIDGEYDRLNEEVY